MGINKKKIVLNILVIGILSSVATSVTCFAEQDSVNTTTSVTVAQSSENPSIIKKLSFEHDLQDVLDTYNTLKEAEKVQAKNNTMDLLQSIVTSDKYSFEEKKSISQETILTAISNSVFEKSEGLQLLAELQQQVDKQSNVDKLDNTIDNILNSNISIEGKSNFCKNALELAKANETITQDEYSTKLKSVEKTLTQLQKAEDERIAQEEAEKLAKQKEAEEQAKKEEEARQEAEKKAKQQAEEQAKLKAEQEQAQQTIVVTTTAPTTTTTTATTTETPTPTTTTTTQSDNQYYDGFSGTLQYTYADFLALCNAVEHEVGNCSTQSKKMVASVIINRALSGQFPSSIYSVITQPNQFTGIEAYVSRTDYASEDTKYWCQYVLDNGIDYANGALFYYAPQWCGYMSYFENMTLVAECDGQRYFV